MANEGWRERFEAARDMDINRPIAHDRPSADPRTYRSEGNDMRFPFVIPLRDSPTARWWEGFFRAMGTLFYTAVIFVLGFIAGASVMFHHGGSP